MWRASWEFSVSGCEMLSGLAIKPQRVRVVGLFVFPSPPPTHSTVTTARVDLTQSPGLTVSAAVRFSSCPPICFAVVRTKIFSECNSLAVAMMHETAPSFNATTAFASSSMDRCSAHSPLPEASRVKIESRTPLLTPYEGFTESVFGVNSSTADTDNAFAVNRSLIPPSAHSRPLRQHKLQPSTSTRPRPPAAALYPHSQYIPPTHHPQDVLPLLNPSLPNDSPDTAGQHGSLRPSQHNPPPRASSSQHVSIISSTRWTPSHPVFTSTSALAAHHGIPQFLPPVPRTTRHATESSTVPSSSSPNNNSDFSSLCSDYLNMLSQKPTDYRSAASSAPSGAASDDGAAALQAVLDVIQGEQFYHCIANTMSDYIRFNRIASPEFREMQDFAHLTGVTADYDQFLTSPMEESPYEDMLATPAVPGAADFDFFTSPAVVDADDFGFGDEPLFSDSARFAAGDVEPIKTAPLVPSIHHPNFDEMYQFSPQTPSLDPSSLQTSPLATPVSPSIDSPAASRRRNAPTGTRKNITPDALVPFDAPIQPRKYVTPSATSRKEIPAVFARKRARSQAFGEEDELADDLPLDTSDLSAIEAKRRQNTLAARRSRKRKLEYQRELEVAVEKEKDEKDMWKRKAQTFEALLRSHGVQVPSIY